jgi:hypothetical protein
MEDEENKTDFESAFLSKGEAGIFMSNKAVA